MLLIGFTLSTTLYEGRFAVMIVVDKAVPIDNKSLQEVADNIYKYIDLLDKCTWVP